MTDEKFSNQITLANTLADISGNIIKQYFRQANLDVDTKITEISSIVTIADRQAEEAMVDLIRKKYPEFVEKILHKSILKMKKASENKIIDYAILKCHL